jgi:hypothetical protein
MIDCESVIPSFDPLDAFVERVPVWPRRLPQRR